MHDMTDVKIFLASLIQPMIFEAVKAGIEAHKPAPTLTDEVDVLLTPEETANFLKVSKVTIWQWSKKGILSPRRIGNQVRYLRSEVLAANRPVNGKGGLLASKG